MTKRAKPNREYEDLAWLVDARSRNQQSAVELYKLFVDHRGKLANDKPLRVAAQALLGVNFALWRAVFLTDVDTSRNLLMDDAERFLKNLIENNTVAYQQDKNANYWTFRFYVSTARNILKSIMENDKHLGIVTDLEKIGRGATAIEWWELHQRGLKNAIDGFERAILASEREEDEDGE